MQHADYGWIHGLLRGRASGSVGRIAEDLRTLDRLDVESMLRGGHASHSDERSEVDYVMFHLDAAKRFADQLVLDGRGFAYLIG
ncbi:MAG: hypothetical protein R2717_04305 [Schumannella sp.]